MDNFQRPYFSAFLRTFPSVIQDQRESQEGKGRGQGSLIKISASFVLSPCVLDRAGLWVETGAFLAYEILLSLWRSPQTLGALYTHWSRLSAILSMLDAGQQEAGRLGG